MKASTRLSLIALAATGMIAGLAAMLASRADRQPRPEMALVTSLPIYWSEAEQFTLDPASSAPQHWVKEWLEQRFSLVLLDTLISGGEGRTRLASQQRLILAQPRVFQPAELVALDNWVRAGGRVLIFADPMLTEESRYSLGDPRRPQMATMLSPILSRWGLEQRFDESQPPGLRAVALNIAGPDTLRVQIDQAGYFVPLPGKSGACDISNNGLVAQCAIGKGRAVLFGDAAILSAHGDSGTDRISNRAVLQALVSKAFE